MKFLLLIFLMTSNVFGAGIASEKTAVKNSTVNCEHYISSRFVFIGIIVNAEKIKIDGTEYLQVKVDIRKTYKGDATNPFTFPLPRRFNAQVGREYFWHLHRGAELEITDNSPMLMSDKFSNKLERLYDYASKGKDEDEIRQRFVDYSKKIVRDERKDCEKLTDYKERDSCLMDTGFWK